MSLKAQLLTAEEDFFQALAQGEDAVVVFNSRWDQLVADIDKAVDSSTVDSETLALVYTIASRIATFADTSIALFTSYEAVNTQLMSQLDTLMSELSLSPTTTTLSLTSSCSSPSSMVSYQDDCESSTTCRKRRRSPEDAEPRPKRRRSSQEHISLTPDFCHSSKRVSRSPPTYPPSDAQVLPRPQPLQARSTPIPYPPSRKRRASESDTTNMPLQSKRRLVGPRLHAVSDSFVLQSPSVECASTSAVRRESPDLGPTASSEAAIFWSSSDKPTADTQTSRSLHTVAAAASHAEHDMLVHLLSSTPTANDAVLNMGISYPVEVLSSRPLPRATSPSSDTSSTPSTPSSCPTTPQLDTLRTFDLDSLLACQGLDASSTSYDDGLSPLTSVFGRHVSECAATDSAAVQVTSATFPQINGDPDWFASAMEPLINMAVPSAVCWAPAPGSSLVDFSTNSPFEITSPFDDFSVGSCTVGLLPEIRFTTEFESALAINT